MTADVAIAQLLLSTLVVAVTLIAGIRQYRQSGYGRRAASSRLWAYLLWGVSGLVAVGCLFPVAHLYTEHLWFEHLGYAEVFWGLHRLRWGVFGVCFAVAAGFIGANAALARLLCPESREFRRWTHTQTFSFERMVVFFTLAAAFVLAVPMLLLDDIVLQYLNQPSAESGESAYFGLDRNFYLFSFPLHRWVSRWVQITLWVTCIVVGLLYNFYYRRDAHTMARVRRRIIFHGSALWLLLLIVAGWRGYVNLWSKVYTQPRTIGLETLNGLFYVDFHLAGATRLYCGVLIGIGAVLLVNMFWQRRGLWYTCLGMWALSFLVLLHLYPLGLHVIRMRTERFEKEGTYLQSHIEETRRAFDLDTIVRVDWELGPATLEMLTENTGVRQNIQIWDRRVLYEALRDRQIKPHYNFHPYTDVDRYTVNGEYRQVLIAAREIDPDPKIEGWDRLKTDLRSFTHGYGVCVAPVNEFVGDGLPKLWVKDTPVVSEYKELAVQVPQIYYGEMIRNYMIVNTARDAEEEDTAAVDDAVDAETEGSGDAATEGISEGSAVPEWMQHEYTGNGGVPLGGWFRRFCFALRFDLVPILISEKLRPESRMMFRRRIGTRVNTRRVMDRVSYIAPFLDYDPDPYIVINAGSLYWIIDFYVTSRYHPNAQMYVDDQTEVGNRELYEEPNFERFNYIRNGGVAVVNAYTGAVDFYAIKQEGEAEPLLESYQSAFPGLFKPLSEMPAGLAGHLRYPDYLTRIQAKLYGQYYRQASGFYDNANPWAIPKEAYYSEKPDQEMMPYYAMLELPGESGVEFVNMIPFAPKDRELQLKGWFVARCDQPHYGERFVYVLSENAGVAGPTQVEEDINKKTGDQQVGWGKTSDIIRGNLLVIPVGDALFYLEAIYLQAKKVEGSDTSRRPELEMVVLKAGSNELEAVAAGTFDAALDYLLLGVQTKSEPASEGEGPPTLAELLRQYEQIGVASEQQRRQIMEQITKLLEAEE